MSSDSPYLGLFPAFDLLGGVQLSGRLAWEAITRHAGTDACRLITYGAPSGGGLKVPFRVAKARLSAIRECLSMRRDSAACIVVWHMDLLKLLWFMPPLMRVALFLHGIEAWRPSRLLERHPLSRVQLFLANSSYTWQRFVKHHPGLAQRRHCVVQLGVGLRYAGPVQDPEWPPKALMLARLAKREDYKGHRQVISAWPRVLKEIRSAELWIAGDGDLRPGLEQMVATLGLSPSVRFCGAVSETEKQALMLRSSCLVLPSRAEGFGLVYLEAMRLGRPCLVSTLDGGREVVNPPEAGLAADADDPAAIAGALSRLLSRDIEWREWSRRARARYEQHFTAGHFQDRLIEGLQMLDTSDGR